ncbi:glycosyltransferase family 2 protein [Algoriphagus sp. AGSA1]|uniref:glycosyltransferase family 2 protein n=1 Tax=Algoriphagus sp. AGSA1 TaxID=2907213 RepID=UPI001F16B986|nr:glycosyltransferase family 2 protein [Algoriphagus sp. AGSA1]MCE7057567.1 glycosyltransferase family 2 protein [Algoriphagus sp. AGSA1]
MHNTSIKISIIIPTYNYGRYIKGLIENLQQQTFQNWEAIIVDDGSTDNTPEQVELHSKGEDRVTYLRITNSGCGGARNAGLVHATGDYLCFLDADDLMSKDKLQIQLDLALSLPNEVITYTDLAYFEDKSPEKHYPDFNMKGIEWMPKFNGRSFDILESLVRNNFTAVSSPLVHRKFMVDNNISFDGELDSKEDWLFWIECALANASFHYFGDDRAKTLIRRHGDSLTVQIVTLQFGEVLFRKKLGAVIERSKLNTEWKTRLRQLNNQLSKWLIMKIIERVEFSNPKEVIGCIRGLGLKTTIIYFIKHLNYKRKLRRS